MGQICVGAGARRELFVGERQGVAAVERGPLSERFVGAEQVGEHARPEPICGDSAIRILSRPDRILRLTIPLESEERWKQTFGFIPPQPTDTAALATHPWEPELQFCATARLQIRHDELAKIDHYLKHGGRARPMIPIKERSLQIFGDEKRLDELHRASTLFDAGRLTLETLRAYIVPEPLPWLRGACPTGPILTLENAATWDTFCRWDKQHPTFSALIYGGGNRFPDGIPHLATLHAELGFTPPHYY